MCGILGGVFRDSTDEVRREHLRRATRLLAHRGPDDSGNRELPGSRTIFGFRRLAIIDLESGAQPMSTGRGHCIVFNGEIYNYRELRRRLRGRGVEFRTTSDTEVLLEVLAHHGASGLDMLNGMFSFGFLDEERHELLLARDRLGIKQLYWTHCDEGFFFASEPKALLSLPWIDGALAGDQLASYFTFRSVAAPDTLYEGIKKLPAGHYLRLDVGAMDADVRPYWRLPVGTRGRDRGPGRRQSLDLFEEKFLEAIERRLVADVPVGAFLSGGLDSSLTVAGMARLRSAPVRTYSAAFPGSPDDEASFARRVSRRFRTDHTEFPTTPASFVDILPTWVELNDDPVADASSLPLLWVSRMARDAGCYVLLSGEGADELFGGYGSYHKYFFLRELAALVPNRALRDRLATTAEAMGLVEGQDLPRVHEYFVDRDRYMGTAAVVGSAELGRLLTDGAAGAEADLPRADGSWPTELGEFDFARRIPDDLLVRTDRATMGASVEARVPFLDHELVEHTFSLSRHVRSLPGISKVLLRRLAVRWDVPWSTVLHRKIGFQLPTGDWFRGPLRPFWKSALDERAVPGLAYETVSELLGAHFRGQGSFEEILWRVMTLELWYRRWIQGDERAAEMGRYGVGVEG